MTHQRVKLYSTNVAPRMLAVENLRMSYRECSLLVPKFNHRSSPACGTFLPLGSASLFSVGRHLGTRFWARSPRDTLAVNIVDQMKLHCSKMGKQI